jgi:hypothetical protein
MQATDGSNSMGEDLRQECELDVAWSPLLMQAQDVIGGAISELRTDDYCGSKQ